MPEEDRCKNCGAKLVHGQCFNCKDLKVIEKGYIMVIDKDDQRIYNKRFEVMYNNKDFIWSFVLGLMYASFSGHVIIGMSGAFIDVLLVWLFSIIMRADVFVTIVFAGCFLIFRIICGLVLNVVCIQVDQTRINKIKVKYRKGYKRVLKNHNPDGKIYLVSTLILFVSLLCGLFWFRLS
mgnify:FL=1